MSGLENLSTAIGSLSEIFLSMFSLVWTLIEDNWFLLGLVGLPLISGIIFSVKSMFTGDD